jgi:hypothetical protein
MVSLKLAGRQNDGRFPMTSLVCLCWLRFVDENLQEKLNDF